MSEYFVGQKAFFSKTISENDIYSFAGICGDFNPVHVNKVEAENSIFKQRVAHGALVASFISTVLGMYLPGPGTIYLEQKSTFCKPVFIGDTVKAVVEIASIDEKRKAKLITEVRNQDDVVVLTGYAFVKLPAEGEF